MRNFSEGYGVGDGDVCLSGHLLVKKLMPCAPVGKWEL